MNKLLLLTGLTISALLPNARSGDWPHWRGAERNGHSSESSGYQAEGEWFPSKPAWKFEAGEGSTSPVVIEGKAYVMGWKDKRDRLVCLDLESGKRLWEQSYDTPRHGRFAAGDQGRYGGPTATPEYDAGTGLLFTLGSDGELRAWDLTAKGELAWRKNLYDEYNVKQRPKTGGGLRDYGYTTAPLLIGDSLVVEVGAESGTVMGFSAKTGEERWRSRHSGFAGHTGGLVPIEVEGIPAVAVLTLRELLVLRTDRGREGETIATHPWVSDWANNILTPMAQGNEVLISSYHTHRSIRKVAVSMGKTKKVWEELFASHVGSPVVSDGRIYFAGRRLYCLDFESGKLQWEGGIFGDGASLVHTADGRLFAFGGDCSLTVVESAKNSPDEYRELARFPGVTDGGPGDAWPHLVFSNGWILCKNRQGQLTARKISR